MFSEGEKPAWLLVFDTYRSYTPQAIPEIVANSLMRLARVV